MDSIPLAPVSDSNDSVNHPAHYTSHPSGIECIEITRHMNFNLGNVVKYLWRCGSKKASIEDLRKAAWYLNDEINHRESSKYKTPLTTRYDNFGQPIESNNF